MRIKNENLLIDGTLVRMEYGPMPDFGKNRRDRGNYYQISIKTEPPTLEVIEYLTEKAFSGVESTWIPKWIKGEENLTEDGNIYVNSKSLYPIKVTTNGKDVVSWDDFLEEYGNAIGSHCIVSYKIKEGALYPQAIYFDQDIKSIDVSGMF